MVDAGRRVFTVVQVIACVILLGIVAKWRGPWNLARYVGTVLVVIGMAGIATARVQLGRAFSLTAQARQLVTHGIYSKIRNPIYVSGLVMFLGFILVLQIPELWLAWVAIAVMQTVRARREARVLEAAFGDAYREYRCKTWF